MHMTLADCAKFAMAHLRGDSRNPKRETNLLNAASYDKLHTPAVDFAMNWFVSNHVWADVSGRDARVMTLSHLGIDRLDSWHCTILLVPERDFALLLATNQGGIDATRGIDELGKVLVGKFSN